MHSNAEDLTLEREMAKKSLAQPLAFPETETVAQLADVAPGKYVNVVARLVSFGFEQIKDKMGEKTILRGTVEDETARLPLRSHRISDDLEKNQIYSFSGAFVYEFPDTSLGLVLTERSRVKEAEVVQSDIEQKLRFVWKPKIGDLRRPIWNVVLSGFVTRINSSSSGLVKRCNACRQIVFEEVCSRGCPPGWRWDFRISGDLSDRTGSIRTIFARHLAASILNRSISEILFAASAPEGEIENENSSKQSSNISYAFHPKGKIEVMEVAGENIWRIDNFDSLGVSDGFNLVFFPKGAELPEGIDKESVSYRELNWTRNADDAKILRRLISKSIEMRSRQVTKQSLSVNGIILLEDPIELFRTERAKLYSGFKIRVLTRGDDIILDFLPQCEVLENAWDYVNWRRAAGATARSIETTLTDMRFTALVAPGGRMGTIKSVLWNMAEKTSCAPNDRRNLVQYWYDVYGIDVDPEETPLLQIQSLESRTSNFFTYPPSQVYFDKRVVSISSSLKKFMLKKSYQLNAKIHSVLCSALSNYELGGSSFEVHKSEQPSVSGNLQSILMDEIKEHLMAREIRCRGDVTKLGDSLYFLPNTVYGPR